MDAVNLSVKATRRIIKYAEGDDPATAEPIAVEEREVMLYGEDAKQALKQMGINEKEAIRLAKKEMKNNGIN